LATSTLGVDWKSLPRGGDVEAKKITVAEGGMVDGSFKMMEAVESAYPQLESGLSLSMEESDQSNIQSPPDPIESLPQA
jgi:cytoskeletal protein CcmA (bactofilin family)